MQCKRSEALVHLAKAHLLPLRLTSLRLAKVRLAPLRSSHSLHCWLYPPPNRCDMPDIPPHLSLECHDTVYEAVESNHRARAERAARPVCGNRCIEQAVLTEDVDIHARSFLYLLCMNTFRPLN